jgi:DNA polymerase IIIc chi subunit
VESYIKALLHIKKILVRSVMKFVAFRAFGDETNNSEPLADPSQSRPLEHILILVNPVHVFIVCFSKIYLKVIDIHNLK